MVLNINKLFTQKDVRETTTPSSNNVIINSTERIPGAITTSSSYVDMTNAEVTISGLDSSKLYTLYSIACVSIIGTGIATIGVKLVINLTNKQEVNISTYTGVLRNSSSLSGVLTGQTGSSSYTAKLQHKTSAGSLNSSCTIVLMAIEE